MSSLPEKCPPHRHSLFSGASLFPSYQCCKVLQLRGPGGIRFTTPYLLRRTSLAFLDTLTAHDALNQRSGLALGTSLGEYWHYTVKVKTLAI